MTQALCVHKSQVHETPDNYKLFLLPKVGKNSFENNPDFLQLVPYVTLYRTNLETNKIQFLCLSKMVEDKNTKSIGFDLSIDSLPQDDDIYLHIAKSVNSYLLNTFGLENINLEDLKQTISATAAFITPDDLSAESEKTKLGIQFFFDCTELKFGEIENSIANNLQWINQDTLLSEMSVQKMVKQEHLNYVFEVWSIVSAYRVGL